MGSRVMHMIIADHVSKQLEITDKQLFLLGGIAPDAAYTIAKKSQSHFYEGRLDDGTRHVNYNRFIEKYPLDIQSEFGLGYLIHLISDDVWLKQVYFRNDLKNRTDADPQLLDRWHSDFRKLNGKLITHFDCENLRNELMDTFLLSTNISEIDTENLQQFKEETIGDFKFSKEELVSELEVYAVEEILDYIDAATEKAIDICMEFIQN
ncbi:zinc dependent phospholipase C family protein [Planococcus soli]|uniref:zinc dependent phospholipase C family protein n=1 Tax=Planococcus soli TaxID=2666072 RepID=UPI00115CDDA4|nr:zinc dependent phospholipase C family protein [Planococcus soli]